MPRVAKIKPKTFFLNELHELSRTEKEGGGRPPNLAPIDWQSRSQKIGASLTTAKAKLDGYADPLRGKRYFIVASPVDHVAKFSNAKNKKGVPEETQFDVNVDYAKDDSFVFKRLGLDLIRVNPDGSATVHAMPERLAQLTANADRLANAGVKEQARWVTIDQFSEIPLALKIDPEWFDELPATKPVEAVIELQPLLTRYEADAVLRDLYRLLPQTEKIDKTGIDYSGRHWLAARMHRKTIRDISSRYFSVQCIHSPVAVSLFDAPSLPPEITSAAQPVVAPPVVPSEDFPTVAVFDTGVPLHHLILAQYRRGSYRDPQLKSIPVSDHASQVASRVVFGDIDDPTQLPAPECRFLDVTVAIDPRNVDSKVVVQSMVGVYGSSPDVRVFNFSFDTKKPTKLMGSVERQESLTLVQDLDNFVFRNDVLVIVASGNSDPGLAPTTAYPQHGEDPAWSLGAWAQSYNALTCGSIVSQQRFGGLASVGWPSPFSRLGPGLADSPKPDFGESGGNCNALYQRDNNLGVWTNNAFGNWQESMGTSFAAPVLARTAAIHLKQLQSFCGSDSTPFAVTAKAFMRLTAKYLLPPPTTAEELLWKRGFGCGRPDPIRLLNPLSQTAVCVWQGILNDKDDRIRVRVPIPQDWYSLAENPKLRICICWDSPVNAGVEGIWACRKINAKLRPLPDGPALRPSHGHASYPSIVRTYDLQKLPKDVMPNSDYWTLELDYSEIAEYPPGTFTNQQRVAFASELFDDSPVDAAISPQASMQALPEAVTMTRLSVADRLHYPVALPSV